MGYLCGDLAAGEVLDGFAEGVEVGACRRDEAGGVLGFCGGVSDGVDEEGL